MPAQDVSCEIREVRNLLDKEHQAHRRHELYICFIKYWHARARTRKVVARARTRTHTHVSTYFKFGRPSGRDYYLRFILFS